MCEARTVQSDLRSSAVIYTDSHAVFDHTNCCNRDTAFLSSSLHDIRGSVGCTEGYFVIVTTWKDSRPPRRITIKRRARRWGKRNVIRMNRHSNARRISDVA